MCVFRDMSRQELGPACFSANPRIHDVISFNIDALLEALIKNKYTSGRASPDEVYRTIEKPAASSQHGRVNIYHLHGFLRFDQYIKEPDRESVSLVLTEQEYFDFFNSPTSIFTYTFLSRLRENSCPVCRSFDDRREPASPATLLSPGKDRELSVGETPRGKRKAKEYATLRNAPE
jgi:hypothetical protein